MPGFGEYLRREREMRGVTLDEIAETTKISTRFLNALEHERFSEIPGGIFTRSFIRAYAQYLGLDEEHVLAEYRRAAQPGSDNDLARLTASRPLPARSSSRGRVVPWVVAAALLAGGYAIYRYANRPPVQPLPSASSRSEPGPEASQQAAAGPAAGAVQPSQANAPAGTPGAPAGQAAGPAREGESGSASAASPLSATTASAPPAGSSRAAPPALGAGDLVLQVSTTEEAWVAVAADGKTLLQGLLPPDSVRIFRAKDSFDVTTGNARGTVLTLNGEPQKSLGRPGEFKRIHLARSDFPPPAP